METKNILTLTDSYKTTHWRQYPPETEVVYSYLEAREGAEYPYVKFFGLQYFIKEYLEGVVVTEEKIQEAKEIVDAHIGPGFFNEEGWRYILEEHGGKLPVRIKAVAEGTIVPVSNVLVTIENTDPKVPWLTNYLETLLVQVWYPTTVATISHSVRKTILDFLQNTGTPELIDFKLHDFGFRGVSSVESAGVGGMAHLTNFKGTDTMAALTFARKYYVAAMPGFSIPASEHSTITSWGKDHEVDAFRNMLEQYPTGLVACVSDSFDIYKACEKYWGEELKELVLARDGVLVVRPDSGRPENIVPAVLKILADKFGYTTNSKGYKVLNDKVRVIQGDGCNPKSIDLILAHMAFNGWSADNVAFGMGGGLLQKCNRDTQRFAFKCSAIRVNGEWRDVYKEPVTDAMKNSKRGRLCLIHDGEKYITRPEDEYKDVLNFLDTVFENGKLTKEYTWEELV